MLLGIVINSYFTFESHKSLVVAKIVNKLFASEKVINLVF